MNSPYWLTKQSKNFEKGDIICLFYEGTQHVVIILTDITSPFETVPLLIKNTVICLRLFETERKLVNH